MRSIGAAIAAVLQRVSFPYYAQSYYAATRTPHHHRHAATPNITPGEHLESIMSTFVLSFNWFLLQLSEKH